MGTRQYNFDSWDYDDFLMELERLTNSYTLEPNSTSYAMYQRVSDKLFLQMQDDGGIDVSETHSVLDAVGDREFEEAREILSE